MSSIVYFMYLLLVTNQYLCNHTKRRYEVAYFYDNWGIIQVFVIFLKKFEPVSVSPAIKREGVYTFFFYAKETAEARTDY